MAVAVAIHPALQDVLGQHLDHADLARPGAGGVQREVARGMKRDGGKDLRLEEVGAAAVMGQGEEGVPCVEIALDLAEIGLEGPEGQEDAAGDAVFGFGPGEDPVQFGGFRLCRGEAVLRDQRAREIEEGLAEDGLGTVGAEDLLVLPCIGEKVFHGLRRQALCRGLGGHRVEEGVEIAAAGGGAGR